MGLQRNLWVKMIRKNPGLMENDAGMEIHKERGFPHQLGKVPLTAAELSHISHRPYHELSLPNCESYKAWLYQRC